MGSDWRRFCLGMAVLVAAMGQDAWACSTCFGDPNSQMAVGVLWGVLVLVSVIVCVLASFTGVGVFWMRRARRLSDIDLDHDSAGLL